MGASPLMSLGIRAMAASYAALQTTGHNIANANVTGYSRQQAELATAQGQFTGAGYFGRGVDVVTVSRAHNEFLTRESANAASLASMDATRLTQLQKLEDIFKTGEAGLGHSATELFNSLVDLASNPSDLATRQVVLARASDMASRFAEAGSALDSVQAGVTSELRTSVTEINSLAKAIAVTNQRIAGLRGLGQPANDVLDERERLISKLSEHVQVSRVEADDGTVAVFIGGGQRLVLGAEAGELKVIQDPSDPSRNAIGMVDGTSVRPLNSSNLGGGKLAGLLRFQNEDLAEGRNLVGQLALSVASALNDQQLRGVSLRTPLGSSATSPMFALGSPLALSNSTNARDSSGTPIGSVSLTITNASAVQASDYDLRESTSSPGSWQLTRLSDGMVSTVNSGDVVDGMRIDINNAQGGDSYLLQPVSRVANGLRALLTDPRDIAAASPLVASTASTNTGTVGVAGLTVNTAPLPAADASARINFFSDTGDYTWELTDSSGSVLSSGTAHWNSGEALPAPPLDINGFSLQLSGMPRSGDEINVSPTPASALASNNGNATALINLRDANLTGGGNYANTWSYAMADIGVRVQTAQSSSVISAGVADNAEATRTSQSGVNLDEEAARLIQYQQSYQAAAKVLQIAQSVFDTLLQTAAS